METIVLPAFVLAFVQKVVDLVAFASAKDWKAVAKQVLAYVAGVVGVFLFKAAELADGYVIPGFEKTVGDLNGWATALVGIAIASGAGVVRDFISSRDNTSSAYVPPLGGPAAP
jgi:hypothetical protein